MTLYQLTGVVATLLTFLIPLYIIFFKSKTFLTHSIIFFFTLGSTFFFDYRLFNIVSFWQVLLIFISIKYFPTKKLISENIELKNLNKLALINIAYFAVITIIFFFVRNNYTVKGGLAQNELRPYVQVIQNALIFISMIVVAALPKEKSEKIIKYYFKAIFIFCIIGILQGVIFKITGFDIFPMRKDFISETQGVSVIGQAGVLRITAGIGEPKQFAKFLNIGLAMILFMPNILQIRKRKFIYVIFLILAILMTSSTTGYIIAIFVLMLSYFKSSKSNYLIIIPGILMLIVSVFFILNSDVVVKKMQVANSDQGEIIGLEDTDSAVVKFFIDNPEYIFTGVGISNAVAYANEYVPTISSYVNNHPYTLRRGIIKIIADGGVLGLALYLWIFKVILNRTKSNIEVYYFSIFQIILIMFFTIEAIFPVSMLTLGLLFSISNVSANKPAFPLKL